MNRKPESAAATSFSPPSGSTLETSTTPQVTNRRSSSSPSLHPPFIYDGLTVADSEDIEYGSDHVGLFSTYHSLSISKSEEGAAREGIVEDDNEDRMGVGMGIIGSSSPEALDINSSPSLTTGKVAFKTFPTRKTSKCIMQLLL